MYLEKVANDTQEFSILLENREFIEDWNMDNLVVELEDLVKKHPIQAINNHVNQIKEEFNGMIKLQEPQHRK